MGKCAKMTELDSPSLERKLSDRLVSLVDIVFGVVFGLSIPTVFGSDTNITIPNSWVNILTISNFALFVAYISIILSWIGYHKAMEQYPFKIGVGGSRRFFMDLAIVFLYAVLIYARSNTLLYLAIFPIIYLFYLAWDVMLNHEYRTHATSTRTTFKYFIIFLITWSIYSYTGATYGVAWIFLIVALISNLAFRYEKGTWRHD